MVNKYKEITLFELENGWLVKIVRPDDPKNANQIDFETTYCKDLDEVNKILTKEIGNV